MTAPGGKGGFDLTALWVPILPETSKLGPGVEKAGKEAKDKFESATKGIGDTMSKGVDAAAKANSQAMAQMAAAAKQYETANRSAEDAAGKLHVTQTRLEQVMNSGKATTTQIATATENYSRAQRNHTTALTESQRATQSYYQAQSQLSGVIKEGGENAEQSGSKFNSMLGGIGLKAAGMAGLVVEGVHLVSEATAEVFEKTLEVGKEVIEHLQEIGEAWENVEHQIELHSSAGPEQLEALNRAAEQIAASGAPVKLDQLGTSLALISTRIKGLDGDQLKTFTTHVLELGERMGEPINIQKLTGALNSFKVPAADADKALESIVHTAQASGTSINSVVEGIAKAGPAASALHLSIGQVGGFISALSLSGVDPGRAVQALSTATAKFAKDNIPLNEGLAKTVQQTQDLLSLGTELGDSQAYKKVTDAFGTRGGAAIFQQIQAGTLDLDALAHSADTGGESLDGLISHTESLTTKMEGMQNTLSAALKPIGLGLVDQMGGALDKAAEYVSSHTSQIIGYLKIGGDAAISFVHGLAEAGAGLVRGLGYALPVVQGLFVEYIRGLSSVTGYIGGFLDTIGLSGMGKALKDLGASGTAMADGMDKLPKLFGDAADGLDHLADATGSKLQNGFDQFMTKAQTSAAITQALGDAILKVPDGKTIKIENNTPETTEALKKLGLDVETLPDGSVTVTADSEKAKDVFQEYVKDVEDKDVEVELKAKPEDDHGNETSNPSEARAAIEKMFGLDQGPFTVPMAAGTDPFAIPGGPGSAPGMPGGAPGGAPGGSGAPGPLGQLPGLPGAPHAGNAFGGQSMPPTPAPAGVSQSNYAAAWQAFQAQGFGPDQWQAYVNLEMKEASFDPTATNASGAYGVGQFMPDTWKSYGPKTPDLATQLAYQMRYIHDRYGSPAAAWAQYYQHKNGEGSYATGYTPDLAGDSGGSMPSYMPDPSGHYAYSNEQNVGKVDKENQKPWWLKAVDFMTGTSDHSYATGYSPVMDGSGGSIPNYSPSPDGHYAYSNEQNVGKTDKEGKKAWWMQVFDFMTGTTDHSFAKGSGAMRMISGPGTGTSDSIMAMLGQEPIKVSNGESINTALSTAMNLPWIRAMNAGMVLPGKPRGFAGGSGALGATDNPSTSDPRHGGSIPGQPTGIGEDIVDFIEQVVQQYNQQTGSQLKINGDFPGGPVGHSDDGAQHTVYRAVDIGGPAEQRAAFIQWWESDPGRTALTRQLIAAGLPGMTPDTSNILGGQQGSYNGESMSQIYSKDLPGHTDHIHLALQAIPNMGGGGAPANGTMAMAFGSPGAGQANGGYIATQYPGYFMAPDGSYVTADQVRNAGTYGGATQAEIDSALKSKDSAQQSVDDRKAAVDSAQKALDKLKAGKPTADGLGVTPATQDEIDAATAALARARREEADAESNMTDANDKYTQTINKPPDPKQAKQAAGKVDSNAESLGGGLVQGALQELGFDGSVFGDPTQWGIWKLFTGGVNYVGGLLKNAGGGPGGAGGGGGGGLLGGLGGGGGGGGGGDLLGGLMQGLLGSTGVTMPGGAGAGAPPMSAASAATVSVAPGAPGMPAGGATVVPGSGTPASGMGSGPAPGPGAAPASYDASTTNNFNGITDTTAIAANLAGQQVRTSRALSVGQPIGGLPGVVTV